MLVEPHRAAHDTREAPPEDRRSTLLRLTPQGEEEAIEAFAPLVAELDRLAGELTGPESDVVARFLDGVADAAERHAEAAVRMGDRRAQVAIGAPVPGLWA